MPKFLRVKDIMVKDFATIPVSATIREAAAILHQGNFSGAPVIDAEGKLVGIVSEKDLFRALFPTYSEFYDEQALMSCLGPDGMENRLKEAGGKNVKDILKEPITATPETPAVQIGAVMLARGIHRLPVLKNGKLVGVVTRREIYRAIFDRIFKF